MFQAATLALEDAQKRGVFNHEQAPTNADHVREEHFEQPRFAVTFNGIVSGSRLNSINNVFFSGVPWLQTLS